MKVFYEESESLQSAPGFPDFPQRPALSPCSLHSSTKFPATFATFVAAQPTPRPALVSTFGSVSTDGLAVFADSLSRGRGSVLIRLADPATVEIVLIVSRIFMIRIVRSGGGFGFGCRIIIFTIACVELTLIVIIIGYFGMDPDFKTISRKKLFSQGSLCTKLRMKFPEV